MFHPGPTPVHTLKLSLEDAILTVSLNRPAHQNRVNLQMVQELTQLVAGLTFDEENVRVLVLKGEGDGFCAGFDGIQITDGDAAAKPDQDLVNALFRRSLQFLPQPVIAMVHGYCSAEATAWLDLCDLVFAASDSVLGPDSISAAQACEKGWVTLEFPPVSLEQETYKLAHEWLQKDPVALKLAKESLQHVRAMTWDAVLSYTAGKQAELKALQANSFTARAQAVNRFLSGQSKPGLGN